MTLPRLLRTTSFRFALLYAAVFAASIGPLGAIVYYSTRAALEQRARAQVDSELRALITEYRTRGLERLIVVVAARQQARRRDALEYSLNTVQGALLAGRHIPVAEASGIVAIPPQEGAPAAAPRRAYYRAVRLDNGAQLVVADDLDWIDNVQDAILNAFGWALAAGLVLAFVGGVWLATRFLERLDAMTRTASAIVGGDLSSRIPVGAGDDEFDRLARAFNAMLDRLAQLMESLKQVTNDVAHDLRTPLARLRHALDSAGRDAVSLPDMRARIDAAAHQIDGILETFAALLRIAEIEGGVRRAGFAPVDLGDLAGRLADDWRAVAEERRQTIAVEAAPGLVIPGDRELLTQLLANLLENALRHTPEGTRIRIRAAREAGAPVLAVIDDGPGVAEAERDKIFRRFYRTERSRTTPGGGLGLALAAAVAELHGATLSADDARPGLAVTLRFPAPANIGKP
ncbi:MAG: HAMP domain-containing protein [Methylobacteriaceae bacterium]|nr:HAMP domain-containing protein [Methylobacteriaceae bacterium]